MSGRYDVAVIGGGPGGYPAAIRAAQNGASVALVERAAVGGTCLHSGCIPTKTLIAGARLWRAVQQAGDMGIRLENPRADYAAMVARKDRVVATLEQGIRQLLKANRVDLIAGDASFASPQTIRVDGPDGQREVQAGNIIIATGSVAVRPSMLPESPSVVDSQAFLMLDRLPERLLVLGGGYIGCELACLAAALGVRVTLVEMLPDLLPMLDRDVRAEIKRGMKNDLGIQVLTGASLDEIHVDGKGQVAARRQGEPIEADMLLAAVGRAPNTRGLNLEAAGVQTDARGYIATDALSRTSVPGIYAVGDVNGRMQLAHAATSQGLCAAEQACGKAAEPSSTLIPGVIFTMPEAAFVGMGAEQSETSAPRETAKFYYRGLGRSLSEGYASGFVKWIADPKTGRLRGASAVGEHATDLIAEATLAIQAGLCASDIAATVHAHPTLSELWQEAAHILENKPVHAMPAKNRAGDKT